jgi:Reverse transcriptase (RNA-dependent DNA polymerase).
MKADLRKTLDEWLNNGIISPSMSAWASALVPVKKKDGSWRYAVDYRQLNKVTKQDCFPVAHNLEQLASNQLSKAAMFISIDLAGACLAIPVRREDKEKVAMATPEGLFEFNRMPFGAMNSGKTYAWLMKIVVGELVDQKKFLSVFDDHLIPAESFLQALFRFAEFLHAVERANPKVGPSKIELFTEEAVWLGHLVKPGGLTPASP